MKVSVHNHMESRAPFGGFVVGGRVQAGTHKQAADSALVVSMNIVDGDTAGTHSPTQATKPCTPVVVLAWRAADLGDLPPPPSSSARAAPEQAHTPVVTRQPRASASVHVSPWSDRHVGVARQARHLLAVVLADAPRLQAGEGNT